MEKESEPHFAIFKQTISDGLKNRMGEKKGKNGRIKRPSWDNNKDLVLSTILDPRFKLSFYLEEDRHSEYKGWLIDAVEAMANIPVRKFTQFELRKLLKKKIIDYLGRRNCRCYLH